MSGSTINGDVTLTVTLGTAGYTSPLTIANTGIVAPASASSGGLINTIADGYVLNQGTIFGAAGSTPPSATENGGIGVSFTSASTNGTLVNDGSISGGAGVSGGTGVAVYGGMVVNNASVTGGYGSLVAGYGMVLENHVSLVNNGLISGGGGGISGAGVFLQDSSGTNNGLIVGRNDISSASAGYGVKIQIDSTLFNAGTVEGGAAQTGAFGIVIDGFSSSLASVLINTGLVIGGGGAMGNAGVYAVGLSSIGNDGTIMGGVGTGTSGIGILLDEEGTITNGSATDVTALISGKQGVSLSGQGSLNNYALINGTADGVFIDLTTGVANTITNEATGTISGGSSGVYLQAAASIADTGIFTNHGLITGNEQGFFEYELGGTIVNTGTIEGLGAGTPAFADGIFIEGGAEIINGASNATAALIGGLGNAFGIDMTTGLGKTIASLGTVLNYGTIHGGSLAGVMLAAGTVTNGTALDDVALITGVHIGGSNAVLNNFGTIEAAGIGNGVYLNQGIFINGAANDTTALVNDISSVANVDVQKNSTIINYGTFDGGSINGVYAQSGVLTNASTGVIIGGKYGAHVSGFGAETVFNAGIIEGATAFSVVVHYKYDNEVINSGTIASTLGNTGNAVVFGRGNDLLVDEAGGVFIGTVTGGTGINTLELAAGGAGTVTGVGSQFTLFQTIAIDTGATWLVEGDAAGLAAGQVINGFAGGDTIVLDGFSESSFSYVTGTGLEVSDGSTTETLDVTGNFTTGSFIVLDVAAGTEFVLCYLQGTRILTPVGEVAVEALAIGDAVVTRFGGYQKIKWVGRQSFGGMFVQHNREQIPVCISAGALGDNLPVRDLFVSPAHSMLIEGRLVLAKALVNGISITQNHVPEEIHYYLIELEAHDCVFAEGVWSESFADGPGLRNKFHNVAAFFALYPDYETPDELALCAPRPERGPELDAVLRPIVARVAAVPGRLRGVIDLVGENGIIEGWAQDVANPELPVLLEVLADGRVIGSVLACDHRVDLAAAGIGNGRCHFRFAADEAFAPEMRGSVEVRRAVDGAMIYMSEDCERALGLGDTLRRAG